jgi:hypothetical protein
MGDVPRIVSGADSKADITYDFSTSCRNCRNLVEEYWPTLATKK